MLRVDLVLRIVNGVLVAVIVHSICIPNSCIFHIAKTGLLICCLYTSLVLSSSDFFSLVSPLPSSLLSLSVFFLCLLSVSLCPSLYLSVSVSVSVCCCCVLCCVLCCGVCVVCVWCDTLNQTHVRVVPVHTGTF